MRQTWRWFGPDDRVSIDDMRQAGAEGVVTALHHLPPGVLWSPEEIARRQREIAVMTDGAPSGLAWEVVESLPVSEDIKRQTGDWRDHFETYRQSLANLAGAGIRTVCYNFMPVLDWTRTDLAWRLANGATCMRFDYVDFAVFDIHILQRDGAVADFPEAIAAEAGRRFAAMDDSEAERIADAVMFGLPTEAVKTTLDDIRRERAAYEAIPSERLRAHLAAFLEEVVPTAEKLGLRMCCHPDDPPFSLLGLPRVVSTEADYAALVAMVDSPANGITLCSGSLGARADNDLPGMMARLGHKVHFLHLRNVRRETDAVTGSFHEAEHLGGNTDMVALVAAILNEEAARRAAGREDHEIPMRPDHGQDILDDLGRQAQPGYPAIGRLKGLAELRGIMTALAHPASGMAR